MGISFFTFTQIAYLVDVYRREAEQASFPDYALFVSYFPHVIAGPLLYHREMLPQFRRLPVPRDSTRIAVGVTIFSIGLFKKVVLADGLVPHVSPIFEAATIAGREISFAEGWIAAAGYTFQIYFDFSGYSDMAIGASLIFGIKLPINFHSPYKATNIIDFWRCWHISLSRFLLHYLYIPLGGNRKGSLRRYVNLMVTMVLGGVWHGASWNFLLWGGLHGVYLMINHAWRAIVRDRFAAVNPVIRWAGRAISWALTFLAIILAWVFFRADTLPAAINVFQGMAGMGDRLAFPSHMFPIAGLLFGYLFLVLCLPNTQQVMHRVEAALATVRSAGITTVVPVIPLAWRPSMGWAALCAAMAAYAFMSVGQPSEFLYFQF